MTKREEKVEQLKRDAEAWGVAAEMHRIDINRMKGFIDYTATLTRQETIEECVKTMKRMQATSGGEHCTCVQYAIEALNNKDHE